MSRTRRFLLASLTTVLALGVSLSLSPAAAFAQAGTASVVTATSSFSGHVTTTNGTPLAGISMTAVEYTAATGDFVTTFTTTTDVQGAYSFLNRPNDTYQIEAHDSAHTYATLEYDNESPYYQPDYIDGVGGLISGLDFFMPLAAHITGTVHGPTPAEFSAGNISAEVQVQDYSSGSPLWADTGDVWPVSAAGTYDVGDLPPDDYRLKFSSNGTAIYPPVTTPTQTVAEGQTRSSVDVTLVKALPGSFGSLAPSRLLDTRIGVGASGAVQGHGTLSLQVLGRGGVPASGVSSVVLNVTLASATAAGSVTAYANTGTLPLASNLNFVAGQIVPNLVVVPVGTDGKVALYNGSTQPIQLVADVSGYYVAGDGSATPGSFVSLTPARLLDTRIAVGATGPVAAHGSVTLQVTGQGAVPATNVSSVVLNVTETGATAAGSVTVYPSGQTLPVASNLNFVAGKDVPNLVVVPVGPDGKVILYNGSSQAIQLVADVSGYYTSGTPSTPGSFNALPPTRLLDSRIGVGATGAVPAHGVLALQVTGRDGVPASGVTSVVLNVTETGATAAGFVTAYPTGTALPIASNLNFVAGQDVPNLVVVPVGPDGKVNLYNGSSQPIHLVADVAGYYLVGP
jgi:hypothetical protein